MSGQDNTKSHSAATGRSHGNSYRSSNTGLFGSEARSATDVAMQSIVAYIRDNHLKVGDPLPSELTIVESLKLSRSSVREAIRTLVSLDILEVRRGFGTFVADMSLEPLVNGLTLRITLDDDHARSRLIDVVDTRQALDLQISRDVIEHRDDIDGVFLGRLINQMKSAVMRNEPFMESDSMFHDHILSVTSNGLIQELSKALWRVHMVAVPKLHLTTKDNLEQTVDAHQKIVDAIVAGDEDAYRQAVVDHYEPLREALEVK